jgi:UDP-N-acetylmuramoyl-L-alanyl-D-glutamate--2,6-diaminopimelate ligase
MVNQMPESRKKELANLVVGLPGLIAFHGNPRVSITGISIDSRAVQPGDLFVALTGGSTDGHDHIPQAIERGVVAVVGSLPLEKLSVSYIQVEDNRAALAYLSAAFYDFPARSLTVIGVTGTDGKTTTSNLIYQILLSAGLRAGVISTVNAIIAGQVVDTGFHVTTPEAPDVQRFLFDMKNAGITHAVVEATSHGLDQKRVANCEFDIGVITNITHEHLDYHHTFEAYREAKARLFDDLALTTSKRNNVKPLAVLNKDDSSYEFLSERVKTSQVCYSLNSPADLFVRSVQYDPAGMALQIVVGKEEFSLQTHLFGNFNVSNVLAAVGATRCGLGLPFKAIQEGIAAMQGVPGRMERIEEGQDFLAYVDFAHTPNALNRALEAVRPLVKGKLIVVFGSAGLRDREKRQMMAREAIHLADVTILTAEDPRTESLEGILAEMAGAAAAEGGVEGQTLYRVADRADAIRMGVKIAQPGDLVMACGKGHEQSMCFGTVEYPWDDRVALRAALCERMGIAGPQMPHLPTSK